MLVTTVLVYIIFSECLVSGHRTQTENNLVRRHRTRKYLDYNTLFRTTEPVTITEIIPTENTVSTDIYTETTAPINEDVTCSKGQSAFKKNDLTSIIHLLADQNNIVKELNDSYYQNAVHVRDKYKEIYEIFEKKFEDRPQHLKHILEEMVQTRQRIEPIVKQTQSLLSHLETYEHNFNSTHEDANKLIQHLKNSKEICRLNCGTLKLEDIITKTSSVQLTGEEQFHCDTFKGLSKTIKRRLTKFQTDYGQELRNRVTNESKILEHKIKNVTNKLKNAAVEQFGMTMYDILNLQDDYYHFAADIQQWNISSLLHDIKQANYEISSKLVELDTMAKKYREYCNTCNNQLVYLVSSSPFKISMTKSNNSTTILEQALQQYMNDITTIIVIDYNNIFEELNNKLNETNVEAYLSKLKPIQTEVASELKKETHNFEILQSLVPADSIKKVYKLAKESKELLHNVEDGLTFIREHMKQI